MVDVTTSKLSSMHFHGWMRGLKTGMRPSLRGAGKFGFLKWGRVTGSRRFRYYLRTKAAADAIKFTVEAPSCHGWGLGVRFQQDLSPASPPSDFSKLEGAEDEENRDQGA